LTSTNLTGGDRPLVTAQRPIRAMSSTLGEPRTNQLGSNARSIERLHDFYTEAPTVGRFFGVSVERMFEL
jgi:hypothetical protein